MEQIITKICKACQQEKPLSEFYFRNQDGKYRIACKKCKSVSTKKELAEKANAETKVCKHCGIEKRSSEYNKAGGGRWMQPYCKPCDSERKKKHRAENIEEYTRNSRAYCIKNKERVSELGKEKRRLNPKPKRVYVKMPIEEYKRRKSECNKRYRENNKEKIAAMKKAYYSANGLEQAKKWQASKKNDFEFVTKKRLRGRIYMALKRGVKSEKTMDLLGCSIEFFKEYFESKFTEGMNWDVYMEGGIHIDHIIPCKNFTLTIPEEQKKCFHYSNLQPLWELDNLKKGTRYE